MITIPMTVEVDTIEVPMSVGSDSESVGVKIGAEYAIAKPPIYDGSYEITPSEEAQTIEIKNEMASQNIVINAIPNNYGLITWDGSKLTVS